MSQEITPFEEIRRTNPAGNEFWSSRDFARVLGYADYRNFQSVIEYARTAIELLLGTPEKRDAAGGWALRSQGAATFLSLQTKREASNQKTAPPPSTTRNKLDASRYIYDDRRKAGGQVVASLPQRVYLYAKRHSSLDVYLFCLF